VIKIHVASRETLRKGPISAEDEGEPIDITQGAIAAAFVPVGEPLPDIVDWQAAEFDTDATGRVPKYYALVDVGPGSDLGAFEDGEYDLYLRYASIGDDVVVEKAGVVRFYS
jgi:hypothetical protein